MQDTARCVFTNLCLTESVHIRQQFLNFFLIRFVKLSCGSSGKSNLHTLSLQRIVADLKPVGNPVLLVVQEVIQERNDIVLSDID